MAMDSTTPLLDTVRGPFDIRGFDTRQLKQLAGELREDTVQSVSFTGGHLGASLGVVELTVADARFAKPLDEDLIRRLAREHEALVTIEENAAGGFAAHVLQFLANKGLLENGLKVRVMTMPDEFIDHNKPDTQYELAGLQSSHIVDNVLAALGCADEADPAVLTHLA